ncbi:hypothetical protein [Kitasatospora sp. NPDC002040]|uniref:hypothetical protein n=1 Tax=Kitasatospora sp. NPDC002040 TaxID=3154661 RepID=UPI00332F6370
MTDDFSPLRAGLEAMVEIPGPVSGVDLQRAQRDGRARLRRRRQGLAVAGATLAVGAVLTVTLVASGGTGGAVGPAMGASGSPSPSATGPSRAASAPVVSQTTASYTGRDPLTVEADFGWLPSGIDDVRYQLAFDGMTVHATSSRAAVNDARATMFRLRAYPAGVTPELSGSVVGSQAVRVAAPAVNGQEAYRVTSDGLADTEGPNLLRWRSADGRWLELESGYLDRADREQVPLRIAAGVRLERRALPLPVRIRDVPAGVVLSSASFERRTESGKETWRLLLNHSTPAGYFSTLVVPAMAHPSGTPTAPGGSIDTGEREDCRPDQGLEICVASIQDAALGPVGGLQGWLGKVSLLGTDPAKWTTDVVD